MDKGWRPRSLRRCFQVVHGHFGRVRASCVCVCNTMLSYLRVSACVCICISLLGPLSVMTRKLCLHFHFPSPAGLSPNLPWQLLSTRQAWFPPRPLPRPPPTLCPMLPRYATDARQLVCCLCGGGRLLETDARATVGPRLRICVTGPALGPRCDLYCWKRLWERVGSVSSSELISNGHTLY